MKILSVILLAGITLFVWTKLVSPSPREVVPSPPPVPKTSPIDYLYISPPPPFLPKVPGDGTVPIGEAPKPTMCRLYANVGKTINNNITPICSGRNVYLWAYKTNRSAKSLYYSWKRELKKLDLDPKKNGMILSVSILNSKNIDLSHYCTQSGKH